MVLDSYLFGGHTTHACIYYVSAHGWEATLAIRAHIQVSNKLLHCRQPKGMALDSDFFGGHTTHACIYYVSAHGWVLLYVHTYK